MVFLLPAIVSHVICPTQSATFKQEELATKGTKTTKVELSFVPYVPYVPFVANFPALRLT